MMGTNGPGWNTRPAKPVSHEAQAIIRNVIERDGMSYVDAVEWCSDLAERKAAPYREAAAEIERWLERDES